MSPPPFTNPLATRSDVAQALAELCAPLGAADGAPARFNAGRHSDACAAIEALARPLWGIAPWLAGGGSYTRTAALLQDLARGFDPEDPLYWGDPRDNDQRLVECGAVAAALLVAPDALLEPLPAAARSNLISWIARANAVRVPETNWLFFRVLANLAAHRLGAPRDDARIAVDMDRIESFDVGDGWYSDGASGPSDHYVAFAFHFYGLIYAQLEAKRDPARCQRLRERATRFARDYAAWFDRDGAALPFGRSLSYRFAQGAFWGALAWAGVEALPWGEIRGLWLRNLRSWMRQPVLDAQGFLVPGYAYPSAAIGEDYNGPASPYWAFKTFLPLALPASHPFWLAAETEASDPGAVVTQRAPRFVVCRSEEGRHVFALCAGQSAPWGLRHDAAKYAKFCYSTRFGFSVGTGTPGLTHGGYDSMLALSDDGVEFRARREAFDVEFGERHVASTWRPWPDVAIRTWLIAAPPWHVRVHRIRTGRRLSTFEGGFAIAHGGLDRIDTQGWKHGTGKAAAQGPNGRCEILELEGSRHGLVLMAEPCTNVLEPRTAIPALVENGRTGDGWLACAVLGVTHHASQPMPFTWTRTATGRRLEGPGFVLDFG